MTEPARSATMGTQSDREAAPLKSDGMLPLVGGTPQTVYVQVEEEKDSTKKVYFSLSGGTLYSGGISWQGGGYALMITFVFVDTEFRIEELIPETPAFWFSDTYLVGETWQQGGCAASLPGTYHFNVSFTSLKNGTGGSLIDPKIVITPIVDGSRRRGARNGKP